MDEKELESIIKSCLNLDHPKSFFLFAGAGSGKTRRLVETLVQIREAYGEKFRRTGQQVAVITYTNAACEEIQRRIEFDSIFWVSTIHSFSWEQIRSLHEDIRIWLKKKLSADIEELEKKQAKGRSGTQAANDRQVKIGSKTRRLENLDSVRQFTYNPNGENIGKNTINHAEVLAILAEFLLEKPLMAQILTKKYPLLLVDESQDTQKDLVDAFFYVQKSCSTKFALFLFGDTMQRIYADGKVGLEKLIADDWEKPAITTNYRCPKRVVELINRIRFTVDAQQQQPRDGAAEGVVRLFVANDDKHPDKGELETKISNLMAKFTKDEHWLDETRVKTLTLEHHMAARRRGFIDFFEPLYKIDKFRTGLLDGTLSGIPFLTNWVIPLIGFIRQKDQFSIARLVTESSPILSRKQKSGGEVTMEKVKESEIAVQELSNLVEKSSSITLRDAIQVIFETSLFELPDIFRSVINRKHMQALEESNDQEEYEDLQFKAWDEALSASLTTFEAYNEYINDQSPFGTHQGIKGLEFPRVMVILDDNEARGFMFSYEKLLGVKQLTDRDHQNIEEGKDTSIDRTRRLMYVTCSRATSSLAIVMYTKEAEKVKDHMKKLSWFNEEEMVFFDE